MAYKKSQYKQFVLAKVGEKGNYYGGDQGWYKESDDIDDADKDLGAVGGCGTVAGANTAAYMAKHDTDFAALYKGDIRNITKNEYIKYMVDVFKYITPKKVPFTNVPCGIWPASYFAKGFVKFAKEQGVTMKSHYIEGGTPSRIRSFIRKGLSEDKPVSMLIGFNKSLKLTVVSPDETWTQPVELHWVNITEMLEDHVSGDTKLKVSTWGGYAYIDLEDFLKGNLAYEAFVYFE